MYRHFKHHINENLIVWMAENAGDFQVVKSLAQGGGVTFRRKCGKSGAAFLVVEHVSQRDRFNVSVGWTESIRFKNWDDVVQRLPLTDRSSRAKLRELVQSHPEELCKQYREGAFFAQDLNAEIIDSEISISDGVPYEVIAETLAKNPLIKAPLERYLSPYTIASLMSGEIPPFSEPDTDYGLHEPFRLTSRMVGWESWFEDILSRAPTESELTEIAGSAIGTAIAQMETTLLPAINRICDALSKRGES